MEISKIKISGVQNPIDIKDTVARANKVDKTENITWAALKDKRDNSKLVPGQSYRITDYVTTTVQDGTQSAGHQFDIIVFADDVNKLNEEAHATLHSGDTYFANSKLEAWKIWYCLDNDTEKFEWADNTNGKGVIYRMIDLFNNDVPYDFKNILYVFVQGFSYQLWGRNTYFKRNSSLDTEVDGTMYYGYTGDDTPIAWSSANCFVTVTTLSTTMTMYSSAGGSAISFGGTIMYVNNSNITTYTFDLDGDDASISSTKRVTKNRIAFYRRSTTWKYALNVIYFKGSGQVLSAYDNSFKANCHDISFGQSCYSNIFGMNCSNNSFGYSCSCNSFENDCSGNIFKNNISWNLFGNEFVNNSLAQSSFRNSFGNNCGNNSFGDFCNYNSFGNGCNGNSFADYCEYNSFGNNCGNNSFGNNCSSNFFGNGCRYISFLKDYTQYVIVENGNTRIDITSTATTSSSKYLYNFTIAQGCGGTSSSKKTISHNTVNDTFQTIYQPANSQVISV